MLKLLIAKVYAITSLKGLYHAVTMVVLDEYIVLPCWSHKVQRLLAVIQLHFDP